MISIILFLLVISSLSSAQKNDCVLNYKIAGVPKGIKHEIKSRYDRRFVMANSNQKYQATDVIDGHMKKERRLVFWTKCEEGYILAYEHGGYGHHAHVMLFDKDIFRIIKSTSVTKAPITMKDVRQMLSKENLGVTDHF